MKICAVICEYSPFHNGHRYLLEQIRATGRFDRILCLMSGNFTQRGEIAVADKFTRARWAVLGGADCVIELPAVFASSCAERFAAGAIRILAAIPSVTALAFGTECGTASDFAALAASTLTESDAHRATLRALLDRGEPLLRAREEAWRKEGIVSPLFAAPNSRLGVEYVRAILRQRANLEPLPIRRIGAGYAAVQKCAPYASASAIRAHADDAAFVAQNVPPFVALPPSREAAFEIAAMTALAAAPTQTLFCAPDCAEGLEFALKNGARDYAALVASVAGKRYTHSRVRRILLQNLLRIRAADVETALRAPLYCRLLAARKDDRLLSALGDARFPLLTRGRDEAALDAAMPIAAVDAYADRLYEICARERLPQSPRILSESAFRSG